MAAVLLPLVERSENISVILTKRTEHLHHHAGQICLPGGAVHPEDAGSIATALRETEEEIGLNRNYVEIAGYLDAYETTSGFLVTPVVGFVQPGFSLTVDAFEVAEVFEVPLDFIIDPANYQDCLGPRFGRHRFCLNYQNRIIWGVTAGILTNFRDRLHNVTNVSPSEIIGFPPQRE